MDFQVQVHIKEQSEPIATQTDSTALCDFQVQAIIPREYDSIAVQTIKEEIRMPNIPISVAQTPAKKRKMSSNATPYELDSATSSTNLASVDVPQPVELIQSGSVDPPSDERVNLESNADNSSALQESQPLQIQSQQSVSNEADTSAEVDDSILNSEVYQIYCQEKDPYEARKNIEQLKACISFSGTSWSFPAEEDFKRLSKSTLNKFWKQKPRCKFEKVKNYINGRFYFVEVLGGTYDPKSMNRVFNGRLTRIEMLVANGYEFWYVADFDKGPASSKWYRAVSSNRYRAQRLAQLDVIGLTKSTLDQLLYDHYLTKNSTAVKLQDFANTIIYQHKNKLIHGDRMKGLLFLESKLS